MTKMFENKMLTSNHDSKNEEVMSQRINLKIAWSLPSSYSLRTILPEPIKNADRSNGKLE